MKVLGGGLREVRYEMPMPEQGSQSREEILGKEEEGGLREIGRTEFREGKVAYISDRLGLHEIVNPDEGEYAVSLHRMYSLFPLSFSSLSAWVLLA